MTYREVLIWKQLSHPYVLPCLGVDSSLFGQAGLCIVSPWMENGSILQWMETRTLTSMEVNQLLAQIARGVEYLHQENVLHGGLRGANIVIDDMFRPRLVGCTASDLELDGGGCNPSLAAMGEARWQAPEIINPGQARNYSTDAYAYGQLCLELYTEKVPFWYIGSPIEVIRMVYKGTRPKRPEPKDCRGREMGDKLWELITRCGDYDPGKRPSMEQVAEEMDIIVAG
ncbi:hypothetical protein JAAARDRAFT_404040 [Jaapia argillacea MUCL 33604]|uniref:Protein kinase domain-containing protein n=1 Tax=Jaapia argillacea MUCL 33604 TaxID=933084 RepID=A0A067PH89_9AGAM|nr:hypothetical protein JAAARDRAFT_404040 [Jaapia argillacea MUCL 33604]